jgi:hypothetical protein
MSDPDAPPVTPETYASREEVRAYRALLALSKKSPIPETESLANLGLFYVRSSLARLLFIHKLYLKALNTHGVIMEFGVRWDQNMALFTTFRNIYEPYNMSRKVIGFDTFEGFPSVSTHDGSSPATRVGGLSVTPDYENYLADVLRVHEELGPRSHIKKHELIKGDVMTTLPAYLERHPETIVALAYFDFDLFEPTKKCLELIKPYLVKNSIVGFDELVLGEFPGETQALREAWGLSNLEIRRDPISPQQSYLVME